MIVDIYLRNNTLTIHDVARAATSGGPARDERNWRLGTCSAMLIRPPPASPTPVCGDQPARPRPTPPQALAIAAARRGRGELSLFASWLGLGWRFGGGFQPP